MDWEVVALPGGAATSGLAYPLPGGERSRIGSLSFELDCSGGGADRQVVVQLKDGTGATVYGIAAQDTQASGETVVYTFGEDVPPFGSGPLGFIGGPLLGGWLAPNMAVAIAVVGAGGGDALSNARLLVHQHPTRPDTA